MPSVYTDLRHPGVTLFLLNNYISAGMACSDINYETFDDPRWQTDPLNCNMFYGCDRTDRADMITIYHHYHYSCGLRFWNQRLLNCIDDINDASCLSTDDDNVAVLLRPTNKGGSRPTLCFKGAITP